MAEEETKEAIRKARDLIQCVRDEAFKEGAKDFTDGQIWQAILDSAKTHGRFVADFVAVRLLEQAIEGKTPASAPHAEALNDG